MPANDPNARSRAAVSTVDLHGVVADLVLSIRRSGGRVVAVCVDGVDTRDAFDPIKPTPEPRP